MFGALRETKSRLNRPLPQSALLQQLPQLDEQDNSLLQENSHSKPTGKFIFYWYLESSCICLHLLTWKILALMYSLISIEM